MNKAQKRLASLAYKVVDGKLTFQEYRVEEQKYIAGLKQ